jgi:hypothetical protein
MVMPGCCSRQFILLSAIRCKSMSAASNFSAVTHTPGSRKVLSHLHVYVLALALLLLQALQCAHAQQEPTARFGEIQGVVSVLRQTSGRFMLAARGGALEEGDVIITEKDSFAQLVFSDGSQVALRPNSRLSVTRYHYDHAAPAQDHMLLDLVRGGLRTITGLIGKRGDKSAYSLKLSAFATIGIRGTDFIARLCEQDCEREQAALADHRIPPSEMPVVVARVAQLVDHSSAASPGRPERALYLGAPLYNSDVVQVSEHGRITLIFTDDTRTVLGGGTKFVITSYRYDTGQPQNTNFLVGLLRGSLRTVTGLIGRAHPEHVGYVTPTATIGIRGTAFELNCAPLGQGATVTADAPATDCDQAVVVSMRQGATRITSGDQSLDISGTQSAVVNGPGSVPTLLDTPPPAVTDNSSPLPETLNLDYNALYGDEPSHIVPGAYAAVFDGSISLSENGKEIILGPGEAGFAPADDGNGLNVLLAPSTLVDVPKFIQGDSLLQNFDFDPMACVVQ